MYSLLLQHFHEDCEFCIGLAKLIFFVGPIAFPDCKHCSRFSFKWLLPKLENPIYPQSLTDTSYGASHAHKLVHSCQAWVGPDIQPDFGQHADICQPRCPDESWTPQTCPKKLRARASGPQYGSWGPDPPDGPPPHPVGTPNPGQDTASRIFHQAGGVSVIWVDICWK